MFSSLIHKIPQHSNCVLKEDGRVEAGLGGSSVLSQFACPLGFLKRICFLSALSSRPFAHFFYYGPKSQVAMDGGGVTRSSPRSKTASILLRCQRLKCLSTRYVKTLLKPVKVTVCFGQMEEGRCPARAWQLGGVGGMWGSAIRPVDFSGRLRAHTIWGLLLALGSAPNGCGRQIQFLHGCGYSSLNQLN